MISKIVSGGQTGADRAALDAAIRHNILHGGWIPKGRKTEDGPLPGKYRLRETSSGGYPARTERNVLDSDGTLIVTHGSMRGGTALTGKLAKRHGRPWLHLDMSRLALAEAVGQLQAWIGGNGIRSLNVAGPRASQDPVIYQTVSAILETFFQAMEGRAS